MPDAPRVLLLSDERALLRRLGRFLRVFGFPATAVCRPEALGAAWWAARPDFLLVDADARQGRGLAACREFLADQPKPWPCVLLLAAQPSRSDVLRAFENGVDDVLRKPVVLGELLARLRAGARALHQTRRLQESRRVEPITGLPSRAAFVDRARAPRRPASGKSTSVKSASGKSPSPAAATHVVVCAVDHFAGVAEAHGRAASDEAARQVARGLAQAGPEAEFWACLGEARFAAWWSGASEDQAREWAERLRGRIAHKEFALGAGAARFTLSVGWATAAASEDGLWIACRQAEEALEEALRSGGDCVARHDEFLREQREWEAQAETGALFEDAVARDLMLAPPSLLGEQQLASTAVRLLRDSGWPALPVVDSRGLLAGVLWRDDVAQVDPACLARTGPQVGDYMRLAPPTQPREASFVELVEFFARSNEELVVITHAERPVGVITRASLAAISQPLALESLPASPYTGESAFLHAVDPCWRQEA